MAVDPEAHVEPSQQWDRVRHGGHKVGRVE